MLQKCQQAISVGGAAYLIPLEVRRQDPHPPARRGERGGRGLILLDLVVHVRIEDDGGPSGHSLTPRQPFGRREGTSIETVRSPSGRVGHRLGWAMQDDRQLLEGGAVGAVGAVVMGDP